MDFITWDDFSKLNDSTPIDEAIKNLDRLKNAVVDAAAVIVKEGENINKEYSKIADSAKTMSTSINGLDVNLKTHQDLILKNSQETDKLAKQAENVAKAQGEQKKSVNDLTKAEQDLITAKNQLASIQNGQVNSITDLKKGLDSATKSYYAMGDATDSSVKKEQLDKIKDLNQQYITSKKVVDDAKKSTTAAAGSYNQLALTVAENKKRLKEMGDGLSGTSDEFKKLKKSVKDGSDQLKEFDEGIGDNQRKVGDYKTALDGLVPGFSGVTNAVETTGKSFWALAANPVGIIILAIAAALGALTAWFTRTETGGDKLAEMLGGLKGIFTFLMDIVAKFGGELFKALSDPKKIFDAFYETAKNVKDAIVAAFKDPLPALKAFGQFLIDQVVVRFKGFYNAITGVGDMLKSLFTGDFEAFKKAAKDTANSFIQSFTGVEDVIGKIGGLITDDMKARLAMAAAIGQKIAQLQDKLEDQEIALIKRRADTELQVNNDILKSQDKLKYSDEQRFQAIKDVTKASETLLAQEIDAANTKIAIAQQEIALRKLNLSDAEIPVDLQRQLNEATAARTDLLAKQAQEQKRLQRQERSIIQEIETEMLAKAKREYDAEINLAKVRSEIRAKDLQEIADDVNEEIEIRNGAVQQIADEQIKQAQLSADAQTQAAKEAALQRIELDSETLKKIYDNNTISVAERINQERALKEQKLSEDKAYVDETTKITEQLAAQTKTINDKMVETVSKNIFTKLATDWEHLQNELKAGSADAQTELNAAFAEGNMSIAAYEQQRRKIQGESNRQMLLDQIDFLEQKMALLKKEGDDTTAVENEIAQARLQISQMTTDQLIADRQKLNQALNTLGQTALTSLTAIAENGFAAEQAATQQHMQDLEAQKAKELALVGDDAQAKAAIEAAFAAKQADAQKKLNAEKRKQAIFERTMALFEVGINTGVAIIKAVAASPLTGGLPFSAIAAAIGALQVAAILSKPIPAFKDGTQYSPEGLAQVNELGPEMIIDPSGKKRIIGTDGPTFTYLKRGSKVIPADETSEMLMDMLAFRPSERVGALTEMNEEYQNRKLVSLFKKSLDNNNLIISALEDQKDEIVEAIKTQPQDIWDDEGYRSFLRAHNTRVQLLHNKKRKF